MEKEFVPYEQALELKELGFDDVTMAGYLYFGDLYIGYETGNGRTFNPSYHISAPLYQQAFRWFREKYGFCNFINFSGDGFCSGWEDLGNNEHGFENFKTYEEAELECLKKLIKISKSN